jgi:hypothetical protein
VYRPAVAGTSLKPMRAQERVSRASGEEIVMNCTSLPCSGAHHLHL